MLGCSHKPPRRTFVFSFFFRVRHRTEQPTDVPLFLEIEFGSRETWLTDSNRVKTLGGILKSWFGDGLYTPQDFGLNSEGSNWEELSWTHVPYMDIAGKVIPHLFLGETGDVEYMPAPSHLFFCLFLCAKGPAQNASLTFSLSRPPFSPRLSITTTQ